VDVVATLDAPCGPDTLFAWVDDLVDYQRWLEIVPAVRAQDDGSWLVDLRGRFGPLARSKRLRMVRTELEPGRHVRFERDERDGRRHSAWVLTADVEGRGDDGAEGAGGSRLTMRLHYGGNLWGPVLERFLRDEIERSKPRLLALASA
jgi:hypothetical protein